MGRLRGRTSSRSRCSIGIGYTLGSDRRLGVDRLRARHGARPGPPVEVAAAELARRGRTSGSSGRCRSSCRSSSGTTSATSTRRSDSAPRSRPTSGSWSSRRCSSSARSPPRSSDSGLHQAAYSAEIIRGGLLSVDQGQLEAAAALGIPARKRLFRIILPQAMRSIIPNATNEVIGLVKGASVVFVDRDPRAVLRGAGHLQPQQPRHPAAARRGRLVHDHHHDPEHRAVLHRAALRPRRGARASADARCSASASWAGAQWARLGDDDRGPAPPVGADARDPTATFRIRNDAKPEERA